MHWMYLWLSIIVILTLIEVFTFNLVTIWFVVSALVALAVSTFYDNIFAQLAIFVLLGIILLMTTRPVLKRYFNRSKIKTNIDAIVGMQGLITKDVLPPSYGEVKVDGKIWTAFSDEQITEGSIVTVTEISGVKLKVEEKK